MLRHHRGESRAEDEGGQEAGVGYTALQLTRYAPRAN